jgi:hypothetical protein
MESLRTHYLFLFEPEVSSLRSQATLTDPYFESDKHITYTIILSSSILLSNQHFGLGLFSSDFLTKFLYILLISHSDVTYVI